MDKIITYSFGEDFIGNLAYFVEENFLKKNKDISRLCFVFGGKRPALFLKKELANRMKKSFFPPNFFSMDEFIEYVTAKKELFSKITDMDACFIIYNLTKKISPDILIKREKFSEFLPWAREILSFIEQLDLEDINIKSLKNIQKNAYIGYEIPESINTLLGNIITLRKAYHEILEERKIYSRGFTYLSASKIIKDLSFDEFDKILFCNFFYLHKTEKIIIKHLYDTEKAMLFFQGDENKWPVLKEISENFSCSIKPQKQFEPHYNFSLHSGFDTHSQVCMAREIIKNIENPDDTVIVLPDAESLIPLLSEISFSVKKLNVSLGYPLKRSSLYSLFDSIFKAQFTKKESLYYSKDYLNVLRHPFIKNLKILKDPSITRVTIHKIEELLTGTIDNPLGGSLFINLSDIKNLDALYIFASDTLETMETEVSRSELKNLVEEIHNYFFHFWENINTFSDFSMKLKNLLNFLVEKSPLHNYPPNFKVVEQLFSKTDELKNAIFNQEIFSQTDIFKIFLNLLENEMISFSGSSLQGLQILGLLETRALNFKNVIVMDVNESILPKLQIYEPLIPREVMINLGLNRFEKEEEIQRYQFMRLISSSENVHLIYGESRDREKSRFIENLVWEREKKENRLNVVPVHYGTFGIKVSPKKEKIKKSEEFILFLKNFVYSASSLNTYIKCPLRFYYRYVLGLKEKDDLFEDIESSELGNFVHKLFEETFKNFVGRKPVIDENFRKYFFDVFDRQFKDTFEKRMKSDSFLIKEVMKFRLERFLDNENKRDVTEIIGVERLFDDEIELPEMKFKITSKIDRIDRLSDGTLFVIDYKTGSSAEKPTIGRIEELDISSRESIKNIVKSFQLPLYFHMIQKNYRDDTINAAFYLLQTLEIKELLKDPEEQKQVIRKCIKSLSSMVAEILNPDVPFSADDEDTNYCKNCPFPTLCQ